MTPKTKNRERRGQMQQLPCMLMEEINIMLRKTQSWVRLIFFLFIMGQGSWILKSFYFWRESLIFQRFLSFESYLLFTCHDLKWETVFSKALVRLASGCALRQSVPKTSWNVHKSARLLKGAHLGVEEYLWCISNAPSTH